MSDITWSDKAAGSTFSHEDANAIKVAVNSKVDKVTGERLITAAEATVLGNTSGTNTGDQDLSEYATTSSLNSGLATKEVKSLLSQTFAGELNLSTGGEVSYKIYSFNTALTPTVAANPVENSVTRVVLDAGAASSFVATNLGTKRAGSDDFTISKQNELLVFVTPDGVDGALVLSYTIKVLN